MNDNERLAICRHCGNKTVHRLLHKETTSEPFHDADGDIIGVFSAYYFMTKCGTCDEISLFATWEEDDNPEDLVKAGVLYPPQKRFSGDAPATIGLAYGEAAKVKKISPVAFSVLIRRALEFLCKERGAKGANLKERIAHLASEGVVPQTLGKMADAIRALANDGAHEMEAKISAKDADDLDDFFVAVVEYVYVAPKRLGELQARMAAHKAAGQTKP